MLYYVYANMVWRHMCALKDQGWAAFSSNLYSMLWDKVFPWIWFSWPGQPRHLRARLSQHSPALGFQRPNISSSFLWGCCGLELRPSRWCGRSFTAQVISPGDRNIWHTAERAKTVPPHFMFDSNFSYLINVEYVFLLYTQLAIISRILGRRHTWFPT